MVSMLLMFRLELVVDNKSAKRDSEASMPTLHSSRGSSFLPSSSIHVYLMTMSRCLFSLAMWMAYQPAVVVAKHMCL